MIVNRRSITAALAFSMLFAGAAEAAPRGGSWDGTWSGAWGGQNATTITVVGRRVVSYTYQGASTPVARSHVTPSKIVYGDNGVTVTMIRTGKNTANATLHSSQGDGSAKLTRE